MTARAFIIAIEDYGQSVGMANQLPGTNASAQKFYEWLTEVKKLDPLDVVACVEPTLGFRTDGTTRREITLALDRLVGSGRDNTGEFYFFFCGHGFSYEDTSWNKPIDVLVCSDFVKPSNSGGACLKLQEVQEKLYQAMGPGDHYYFVEACRNLISHKKINVTDMGLTFEPSELKKPYRYTLFSTIPGEVTALAGGFTNVLVQGLNGKGRAKGWNGQRMFVTFDLLCNYVETRLSENNQEVDPYTEGNGKGNILEINPVPEYPCDMVVDNATPQDEFSASVRTHIGQHSTFQFRGKTNSIRLRPFEYSIEVAHPSSAVVQVTPPPSQLLDLFDPCEVHFEKRAPGLPSLAPIDPFDASLNLTVREAAPQGEVLIEEVGVGTVAHKPMRDVMRATTRMRRGAAAGRLTERVSPGTYIVKVRERGVTVGRQKLSVASGESVTVDLLERSKSPVKERILDVVTGDSTAQVALFSEAHLGPMLNWDLGLWLSLFGAASILGPKGGDFKKISRLPLASFGDAAKDDSFVYVLAGFEKTEGEFQAGLGRTTQVNWQPLEAVKKLTGIYHLRVKVLPGSHLISIQLPGHAPRTLSTYSLPNRATLLIFAEDEKGRVGIHQYLLPIGHLFRYLPPQVMGKLKAKPLKVVRSMALAQKQFARKRPILQESGDPEHRTILNELIYSKWLDPVMSLIAAYDLIREEGIAKARQFLDVAIRNLRLYFAGIPDIEVIARLIGRDDANPPAEPPLLLEGILGHDEERTALPLPADKLDYGSPWTSWIDAVSAPVVRSFAAAKARAAEKARAKAAAAKKARLAEKPTAPAKSRAAKAAKKARAAKKKAAKKAIARKGAVKKAAAKKVATKRGAVKKATAKKRVAMKKGQRRGGAKKGAAKKRVARRGMRR